MNDQASSRQSAVSVYVYAGNSQAMLSSIFCPLSLQKTSNLTCTKRRGVQDLVTVVTMRMTKYKTLIENIIKNTKGQLSDVKTNSDVLIE